VGTKPASVIELPTRMGEPVAVVKSTMVPLSR
jgi:hypothetical protein